MVIGDTISSFLIEKYIQIYENIWEIRVFLPFHFDMNRDLAQLHPMNASIFLRKRKMKYFLQ